MVAAAAGCRCAVTLPDDAAAEKGELLRALGADVARVRPVSIAHPGHFVNAARRVGGLPPARHPHYPADRSLQLPQRASMVLGLSCRLCEW